MIKGIALIQIIATCECQPFKNQHSATTAIAVKAMTDKEGGVSMETKNRGGGE